MLLKSAFLFQLLTFKFHRLVSAQNADVGRIFIGSPDPATGLPVTPVNNEYSFSSSNLLGQTLPVYALVFSGSNPAQIVPKTENITVNCVVPAANPGYTGVQISPVNLMATENSTQVPLLLTTSGRSVEVSCFGQSQSAACPVTAGGAQFCPGTSQSNSVFITVRPPGTVSICETEIILKDNGPGSNCGFSVCLSEPVSGSSVNVTCTSSGSLTMTIQTLVINVGGSGGQVVCSVPNPVAGSEANVTCRASSQTGSQFISSNTVETSTARFVLRANTVNFQPAWSQIYNTSFSSFFYLTGAVESGIVSVSCQAVVVGSVAEAESAVRSPDCSFTSGLTSTASTATTVTVAATTTVTSTVTTTITTTLTNVTSANGTFDNTTQGTTTPVTMSTTRPTTPPDPASPWRVVNSDFDISSSPSPLIFQPVTTERLREVIDVRTEVIVTTCCVLNTSSNLNYRGQSAVAVAVADIAPYVCSKCDSAAITNPGNERVLQNPGFVEVSPCSCDLTQNGCDINCCCDSDCSQNQRARFSACIPGLPGGQSAEPQDYKCSSNALNQPDWQLLTCVYWENNGYLGMFYMNRQKLQSIDQINVEVYRTYRGKFSLSETERRFTEVDSILPGYQYGTIVQTCRKDVAATSTGTLALSQLGPGATCNPLSPVRYLIDQSSHCRTIVTRDACSPLSVLSARVYAVSSTVSGCSQFYKILKTFKGNETALADVRYYCATDLTLVLPPATPSLENLGPTASSSFPANLANVNCSDGCSDPACWQYNTNQSTEVVPPSPPQCTWDDGFTSSPVPSLEGDTCFNVVVDVRYNFEWRGSEITKLSAIIILANIPNVGSRDVEIVQKFSVNWLNKPNTTVPVSDNYTQTSNPYERSGTAGYDIGKPLASGCAQYNTSTGQFDQVDVISQKQMAIWRPGVDGLCANARRQQITFGDDALSGCALRLTFADLNDSCDELRKLITNHLNVLMAADVIGRYGYNNAQDESMWIPVLRQQLNITTSDSGSSVPANTSTVGNSTILNVTSQELFTWASAITGICLLPSAVNLHILYAQTGAVNGYPRLEVVGAFINYTVSNFTMDCMGVNKRRCDPGSGYTQNFILSSSVTFIKVPPTLPVAHSRFYTRCDPDNFVTDSCYRYFMDFATEECYYDTCWQELAYPVLPGFLGDSQPYSLSFFLVLVLGVVGYVSVARPGWS